LVVVELSCFLNMSDKLDFRPLKTGQF